MRFTDVIANQATGSRHSEWFWSILRSGYARRCFLVVFSIAKPR
ncbi:hypothetical protein D030_0293, partial [Vibrio parahaemolyticus AQ3810]